ncbi:cysteine hydrolase [Hoeflea sp. WL0058]|uniref:Cysteine hydrolase n=1 Tax=Flavimaribacter sediminis TaxID=2865987 RepID=A0AAE2ZQH2_9HYPH|nr:cysteine hydrolase family protein [Flavimaribacter sediminis]MBW8637802.1 cysteine hydrolase [Flavimaribacter sediminis]
MTPTTLLELAGADLQPPSLDRASLVLIDMQNEYVEGPIAVTGCADAVKAAAVLLERMREAGRPIIHVAHKGRPGSLFDRDAHRGRFIEALDPHDGEAVVEKGLPNAFAGTTLAEELQDAQNTELILVGFMTHMCVSSTARVALDLGYRVTIDARACATRDLPDGRNGVIDAQTVHDVALAELADRFAIVARDHDWR